MEKLTCKDLMVWDYVMYNGEVLKVEEISKKGWIHLEDIDIDTRVLMTSDYIIKNLEPIPLTAEILEKNGFGLLPQNTKIDCYYISHPNNIHPIYGIQVSMFDVPDVIVFDDNKMLVHIEAMYVHELQHALKLCKIDKEIEL